jgi:hypothetical protein
VISIRIAPVNHRRVAALANTCATESHIGRALCHRKQKLPTVFVRMPTPKSHPGYRRSFARRIDVDQKGSELSV